MEEFARHALEFHKENAKTLFPAATTLQENDVPDKHGKSDMHLDQNRNNANITSHTRKKAGRPRLHAGRRSTKKDMSAIDNLDRSGCSKWRRTSRIRLSRDEFNPLATGPLIAEVFI